MLPRLVSAFGVPVATLESGDANGLGGLNDQVDDPVVNELRLLRLQPAWLSSIVVNSTRLLAALDASRV